MKSTQGVAASKSPWGNSVADSAETVLSLRFVRMKSSIRSSLPTAAREALAPEAQALAAVVELAAAAVVELAAAEPVLVDQVEVLEEVAVGLDSVRQPRQISHPRAFPRFQVRLFQCRLGLVLAVAVLAVAVQRLAVAV